MKTKVVVKLLVGLVVIGGGVGYFMYQAMQSSWSYYYSVDDFFAKSEGVVSQSLRLAGRVKADSIARDVEKMNLRFVLAGSTSELPVNYKGAVPDNFEDGREVVVEGRLDTTGTFLADTLMTRCESKYSSKLE